jgi:glycerophosphoryl diester phosphodiesterase
MESIADMTRPFIWAHRGASSCAPENTMAAFSEAVACGADGIELDIHLSSDGVPVVIHDNTLDRTTDGRGAVGAETLQQLQRLDAGSWFDADYAGETIPALDSVLANFAGRLRLNLEIKELRAGMAVLELISRYPSADIVVSSFNYSLLHRLRCADPNLPIAVLYESGNWRFAVRVARELSACAFHPSAERVNRPMIAACRRAGLPVFVWTVDHVGVARSLVRDGAAGFFTNDPRGLKADMRFPEPGVQ